MALDQASLSAQGKVSQWGFRIDAGTGEMYRTLNLADSWSGPNRYVSQAYVSYKPIEGSSLQLDFGKFYATLGAEVPASYDNFNYSRSLVYVLGEPFYHLGIRSTVPITKTLSVGVQLLNGCNNVGDFHSAKALSMFSGTWTKSKWNWSHFYMVGPEQVGSQEGFRQLHNMVVNLSPTTSISGYVEAVHGTERWQGGRLDAWQGVAGAVRLSAFRKWSLSPRLDWFRDTTGYNTGVVQQLKETTVTVEYRPAAFGIARAEYRRDWSDHRFFEVGSAELSREQNTFLVAWIFLLKRNF